MLSERCPRDGQSPWWRVPRWATAPFTGISSFWLEVLSVQFSCSVASYSLQSRGLQPARLPCPSPAPRIYSNSCPLSRGCHPTNLILCRPLLFPPSIFPSIRVFSNESVPYIRWPKYWSFSFNISPSSEYSGLISLRIYRFDPCVFLDICFSISAFPIIFYTIFLDSTYMC